MSNQLEKEMSRLCGERTVRLPCWVDTARHNRTIGIDACIAKVIWHLWDNGIETLGCCCGHTKEKPNVVVGSGVKDVNRVYDLIAEVDERDWEVMQWRLVQIDNPRKPDEKPNDE